MTEAQIEVIRALADNGMSVSGVAKAMGKKPATIHTHITAVQNTTGKDPLDFRDLNALLKMAERQKGKKKIFVCTCKICGAKFEAPDHRFRLCGDKCRAAAKGQSDAKRDQTKAEYMREYRKKMLKDNQEQYRPYNAPELSIAEVNELARANGMSYGQYMAHIKGK